MIDRAFMLVPAQAYVAEFLKTFEEFAPRQKAESFSLIPVAWAVEGARVRAIRADGRGEHAIEVLTGGRIRVALPIGVEAVYARAGS